jgi:hypothetical protein
MPPQIAPKISAPINPATIRMSISFMLLIPVEAHNVPRHIIFIPGELNAQSLSANNNHWQHSAEIQRTDNPAAGGWCGTNIHRLTMRRASADVTCNHASTSKPKSAATPLSTTLFETTLIQTQLNIEHSRHLVRQAGLAPALLTEARNATKPCQFQYDLNNAIQQA